MKNLWDANIDSHAHPFETGDRAFFEEYMKKQGFSGLNLVSVACARPNHIAQNALTLNLKRHMKNVYAHASLVYDEFPVRADAKNAASFLEQAQKYRRAGFDGIKILESKPTLFKKTRLKLSDATYDPFFSDLEAHGTHIVWHACDPAPFWDADKAPAFARESGWFYGDGTFEPKESLTQDVIDVLRKHPKLNATMAHFFFLSDDLDRAARLLDEFPRLCLDITPGREMYENFSLDYERARAFFRKYAERLHFGTDMTSTEFQGDQAALVETMRRFLCTEDTFEYWDYSLRGMGLPEDAVRAIAGDNFRRDVAPTPCGINDGMLWEMLTDAANGDSEESAYFAAEAKKI